MNEPVRCMSDESRGPKKGESAGVVVKLVKLDDGQYSLPLPTKITDGLGWNVDDDLDLEFTELCETWGETQGCVIRNLTKERKDVLDELTEQAQELDMGYENSKV